VPDLVAAAGEVGWSVVSGGALGIDAAAHEAALDQGVVQLAVLPCGSDNPYPPRNRALFDRIAGAPGSGILYAQPRGRAPTRSMFASRNRIIVGLAAALIVVEAELRSGSIGTGRLGLAMGIPTAVIAGSRGCAALAAAGAMRFPSELEGAALRRATRAWLEAIVGGRHVVPTRPRWPQSLAWLHERIEAAGARGLTVDDVPDRLAGIVGLTEAETLGLVQEIAPGRYVLA
jgi:DNA processing protein